MARTPSIKITADTPIASLTEGLTAASDVKLIEASTVNLTRREDAVSVRSFTDTLAIKRAAGRNLTLVVDHARAAGVDVSKVGAVGTAVTFAHVAAAIGRGNTTDAWSFGDRARATCSEDLNAWLWCDAKRVATFRALDADALSALSFKHDRVDHAITWCRRDADPSTNTNRASAVDPNAAAVKIVGDDRAALAATLGVLTGPARDAAVTVKLTGKDDIKRDVVAPAILTPSWLAAQDDDVLAAAVVLIEGERKRRALAKAGKLTAPAAPAVSAPTADAVATVTAAPAPDVAAITAAVLAALAAEGASV